MKQVRQDFQVIETENDPNKHAEKVARYLRMGYTVVSSGQNTKEHIRGICADCSEKVTKIIYYTHLVGSE